MNKLFDYWYIVAKRKELKAGRFYKKKILNQDVLLVVKSNGDVYAIEDRCCHRNVHLSLGFFNNDQMTCSYHGWTYNENGQCVTIPPIENNKIPKTACINSYKVKEKYGFIWLCLNKDSGKTIPDLLGLDFLPHTDEEYVFPANLDFVSESLIDPYHINYVHRKSIGSFMGDLKDSLIDIEIEVKDERLKGSYKRKNNLSFTERAYFSDEDYIKTEFEFIFPNISILIVHFSKRRLIIYEHIMQLDDQSVSMREISAWENIFSFSDYFARFFMKQKSKKIVHEDLDFMKSQRALNKNNEYKDIHTKADIVSIEFRKHWERCLKG